MSTAQRLRVAEEIVRRIHTVALLHCEEVSDIRNRALSGNYDEIAEDVLNAR